MAGASAASSDPNAWGLEDETDPSTRAQQPSAPSSSPLLSRASAASGLLPADVPRRSSVDGARTSYAERVQRSAVYRADRLQTTIRTAPRRRRHSRVQEEQRVRALLEQMDLRPWGHWSGAGLKDGQEPKYPFPHRTHLFTDCALPRAHCTDGRCAMHGRGCEDDGDGDSDDSDGASTAATPSEEKERSAEVAEEKDGGGDAAAYSDNMTVVRLRGAGDAALLAAFSRATPAYAALSKRTSLMAELNMGDVTAERDLRLLHAGTGNSDSG